MQPSVDVFAMLVEDPIVEVLMSLTCRRRKPRAPIICTYPDSMIAVCNPRVIQELFSMSEIIVRATRLGRVDVLEMTRSYCGLANAPTVSEAINRYKHYWYMLMTRYDVYDNAARYGQLAVMEWCRGNGVYPLNDSRVCRIAAEAGQLDIIIWCRDNKYKWDVYTCASAAMGGHLAFVQWCVKNGCPCNEETCLSAVIGGHLAVLQWCVEYGCPWNINNCRIEAFRYCYTDITDWINSQLPAQR
jgi:hypothetical protein